MSDDIPEVNAKRRRKGSQPTGQASKPVRQQTPSRPTSSSSSNIGMTPSSGSSSSGSSFSGSSTSSGSSSSGSGGLGGLGSLLGGLGSGSKGKRSGCSNIIVIIVLFLVVLFLFNMCSGDGHCFLNLIWMNLLRTPAQFNQSLPPLLAGRQPSLQATPAKPGLSCFIRMQMTALLSVIS